MVSRTPLSKRTKTVSRSVDVLALGDLAGRAEVGVGPVQRRIASGGGDRRLADLVEGRLQRRLAAVDGASAST